MNGGDAIDRAVQRNGITAGSQLERDLRAASALLPESARSSTVLGRGRPRGQFNSA